MKAAEDWKPSKFVINGRQLHPTHDFTELAVGSRLVAECMCGQYQEALQRHAKGRLLDLGCGKVPLYAAYRELVDEIVCVDWANTLHESKHVDFLRDLNEDLDLNGQLFDTVLLSDVLEHIRKPDKLLAQIHGLMRAGGKVIIGVPFFYHIHEAPNDFFRYTRYALISLAEESGFKVCYLEETGGALRSLPIFQENWRRPSRFFKRQLSVLHRHSVGNGSLERLLTRPNAGSHLVI